MHDAITRLDELLGAGQAAAVVEVAEYTLDRVSKAMGEVDDSSGYFSDIVAGLEDLHLRASVAAKPDPVALARRLFVKEVDAEWDIFVDLVPRYADVLGDAGLEEFRRLADERWAGVKPVGPGEKDDERYGRRYRITRIMERLAEHDGDIDRLVEVKSRDLSMPYDWLQIAETLAAVGRHDEALSWAGRGVAAFPDQHDPRLDEFLCDEYHRHGRPDDALMLTWERFQASPSLTTYQRLADHAARAEVWDDWRPNAIAILRRHVDAARRPAVSTQTKARSRGFRDFAPAGASVLVEVLLWEGDSDSAWSEAQGGGVPERLWLRMASAREKDHPDDAIPVYQREVEALIGAKKNQTYAEAVRVMEHIAELFARAGRGDEFKAYAAEVRARHTPKRNLMKRFDAKGW